MATAENEQPAALRTSGGSLTYMPKGTKVHSLYEKLKAKGYSVSSAVKIAQATTGQALATGKPPKGKSASNKTKRNRS